MIFFVLSPCCFIGGHKISGGGGTFATVVFLVVTSVLDVLGYIARQILLPSDNINLHHNAKDHNLNTYHSGNFKYHILFVVSYNNKSTSFCFSHNNVHSHLRPMFFLAYIMLCAMYMFYWHVVLHV